MGQARPPRRRLKPRTEDSRKTGWTYRGLFPLHSGIRKLPTGHAWIHALGMMPGVPDLEPWQQDRLLVVSETAKTLRAHVPLLQKWGFIDKVLPLASEAAMIEALKLGPLVATSQWYTGFDLPPKSGILTATGRARPHAYAIAGYSEKRQAYRIMNSYGPGWGQLGRAWLLRGTFLGLYPSADVIFAVASGVPWSEEDIEWMDSWEHEYAATEAARSGAPAGLALPSTEIDLPDLPELMAIDALVPDPKNARRHPARNLDTIRRSLREVGPARSIVIDEDNEILAGNGVVRGAKLEGIRTVRIIEPAEGEIIAVRRRGLTKDQKTRLALFDNRAGELAEWDDIVLPELLNEVGIEGLFTKEEFDKMLLEPDLDPVDLLTPPDLAHVLVTVPVKSFVKVQALVAQLQEIARVEQGFTIQTTGKAR